MGAEGEGVAVAHREAVIRKIGAEELAHHAERRIGGYHGGFRVNGHKGRDVGGVVGFHVVNDEIVGAAVAERGADVCQPLRAEVRVNGVHHRDLFVDYYI